MPPFHLPAIDAGGKPGNSQLRDARVTKLSKRLEAMRANPRANWKIADIEALCWEFGLHCKPPSGGGSHFRIGHKAMQAKLTIPFRRPIKPVYIRQLVAFIDELAQRR